LDIVQIGREDQVDPNLARPGLQEREESTPGDADEAVPRASHDLAFEVDVDVFPPGKRRRNGREGGRIGLGQGGQGLVGKDHAPAERLVFGVSFDDPHLCVRQRFLQQQSGVQASRAAPDTEDAHR
jgi:hypothetical protein